MRVYLLTVPLLRRALDEGGFGAGSLRGHAVTDALAAELPDTDDEEREYAALTAAALDALSLLGPDDPPVRLVAAVEAVRFEPVTGPDEHLSAVLLLDAVPLRRVAAVHADSPDARADVTAARAGDEEAAERCLDRELGWYAVQELEGLLESVT